ncbi:hypothetical protein R3P38DRAFT_3226124 [Favolaschia claudopus]|uniref:Uncharacterized protein n=1 Tax=Favolaschia claudopus TaxID=2862362 RepID=A0AAV9ZUY6_9AGAR
MSSDNDFLKSDWILQNKKWATAPPRVKKGVSALYALPQIVEFELLPSPYLPIAQMLEFKLPFQNPARPNFSPLLFFSSNLPDALGSDLVTRIRHLPIPDSKTIKKLVTEQVCAKRPGSLWDLPDLHNEQS